MSHEPVAIVSMKWGTEFPPDYVNVLYSGVKRNIRRNFNFYCITDDERGLDPRIIPVAFDEENFGPLKSVHGCWPKVSVFDPDLYRGEKIAVFLDLDIVILQNLEPIVEAVEREGGLHIIREWNYGLWNFVPLALRPDRGGQSSIFGWEIGTQKHLLENFLSNRSKLLSQYPNDQQYIGVHAADRHYFPYDWTVSFKRSCVWYFPFNLIFRKVRRPARALAVIFHGEPRPFELVSDAGKRWGTRRKFGFGPVDWVRHYWLSGLNEKTPQS